MTSTVKPFLADKFGPTDVGPEWARWKRNFGHFLAYNKVTEPEQMKSLLLLLGGEQVQETVENLGEGIEVGDGRGPLTLFQSVMRALDTYYASSVNVTVERHIFNQLKQNSIEKMEQFAIRLRAQAKRCAFGDQQNSNIRDRLIAGCTSLEMRRELLRKGDASLVEILDQSKIIEAVDEQMKTFKPEQSQAAATVNKIDSKNECGRCGRSAHNRNGCPAMGKTCNKCGKLNHFAAKCRSATGPPLPQSASSQSGQSNKNMRRFQPYNRFKANNQRSQNKPANSSVNNVQAEQETEPTIVNNIEHTVDPLDKYVFHVTNASSLAGNRIMGKIGGVAIEWVIDSGSQLNIMDMDSWKWLKSNDFKFEHMSKETDQKFSAYGDNPLLVKGMVDAVLQIGEVAKQVRFYVVEQKGSPLLGLESASDFGVLKISLPSKALSIEAVSTVDKFNTIKGIQLELPIDPKVPPVWQPYRRIPIQLEEAVDNKLDELLAAGIIEPVVGHTSWVSPMVIVTKDKAGEKPEVRICIDMRCANKAILRENHPLPVISDILPHINNANIFSKLDVKLAFHQIELAPKSRYITAFITRRGVMQYTRLMFGVNCAPEKFQKIMEKIVSDLPGVRNAFDDLLVWGKDQAEHDERLAALLKRLKEYRVLLNKDKCILGAKEVPFLGHVLFPGGMKLAHSKIEAIQKFIPPPNAEVLRSFLGMVTFVGQYIPDLATITHDLRIMLKKDVPFNWGHKQQQAFDSLKAHLTGELVLDFFNINDQTVLYVDASPVGLGAILVQIAREGPRMGKPRVINYASKSLSATEQRYCQTEKEALAVVWGIEHNHFYLYGREFDLVTDHKPLEVIFGAHSKPCARIQRWVLRLQA